MPSPEEFIPFAALMIPITALMIPITAIICAHRKSIYAMKLNRQPQMVQTPEVEALRAEVRELKEMVHMQMLALDRYARPASPPVDTAIQDRISANR